MREEETRRDLGDLLASCGWRGALPSPFAHGGASELYLLDLAGGRRAVLKTPRYEARAAAEHRQIERGLAFEAAVLRAASSPFLPRLIQADAAGRFLVREYVPGAPLSESRPQDPGLGERVSQLLDLACDLFSLFHCHRPEAYILRDLKPVNLIWGGNGVLKLVDVGSVRPVSRARARTARREMRLGSGKWLFWAPEQLLDRARLPRESADYFALGATAFFLLTGAAPYGNADADPNTALQSYLDQYSAVASRLQQVVGERGLPESIAPFLRLCLHPLAEERPMEIPTFPRWGW